MRAPENESVNLLWTGGWDSTFRLLQLLLLEKKRVNPHYIIYTSRKSTIIEIKAMDRIRQKLLSDYPELSKILNTTTYFNYHEIVPSPNITTAWKNIKTKRHIGTQFESLARYVKQEKLDGIEICMEKEKHDFETTYIYKIVNGTLTPDEKIIFRNFSFPLKNLAKKEMETTGKQNGWMDYMNLTWFCHRPYFVTSNHPLPCGACNPCITTVKEGLGYRVPFMNRISGRVVKKIYNSVFFGRVFKKKE